MNGRPPLIAAMLFWGPVYLTLGAEPPEAGNKAAWQSRYRQAADEYALYRDSIKLELQPEPVYRWSHAARSFHVPVDESADEETGPLAP